MHFIVYTDVFGDAVFMFIIDKIFPKRSKLRKQ